MKALLAAFAALLALSPSAFAQQQTDLAADFATLRSRIFHAETELMARRAEIARLTQPVPKGPKGPRCNLKDRDPNGVPARLRQAVSEVAFHIAKANGLDIPVFCGVVLNADDSFNAGSVVQPTPIQEDDAAEAKAASYGYKYIGVNLGVLEQVQDDSELAAVLGHELAHLVLGHSRAAAMRGQAAEDIAEDWQDSPFVRPDEDALRRWYLGHAQSYELEADRLGAIYAARAGYDPLGEARLFVLIPSPPIPKGAIADHPSSQDRLAAFQKGQAEALATPARAKPLLRLAQIQKLLSQLPVQP